MKKRMTWVCGLFLLTVATATVGFANDEPTRGEPKRKPAPIMAGFGMIAPQHSCTDSYSECMTGCSKGGGASCELECVSDCNVCALDFGEEALDVCRQ